MKKSIFTMVAIAAMTLLSSCDSKICICYERVNGNVTKTETLADPAARCSTLSTSRRTCVEEYEELDPSQIAIDYKR